MCKTVSSKILLLRQLSEYVPIDVLKQFYQSNILLLIENGFITWGSASPANLGSLERLIIKTPKTISNLTFDTPSAMYTTFQELGE